MAWLSRTYTSVEDDDGETLLSFLARRGDEALLRLLLHNGANIAATDNGGKTALHWGAECGQWEVVRLLLWKGADISATDNQGETALHCATTRGYAATDRIPGTNTS